jgi:ABC-type lipoprotein export system ATPase subunit
MTMITLSNVTRKYYLDDKSIIEPVKDLSLDIGEGEFIVIIGRSGSGKTTLLNLIAGLIKPSAGTVSVGGSDIQKMNDREISALRNRKMGFVFQFPSLLPPLTVMENITLPRDFAAPDGHTQVSGDALELLKMVGLETRASAYPKQLSAGEQRRAVIARALINNPQVILADEPTSDLDEKTESEIMSLLMDVRSRGVTVIMVTHNLDLVPFATRAFNMRNGGLAEVTTTSTPTKEIFDG